MKNEATIKKTRKRLKSQKGKIMHKVTPTMIDCMVSDHYGAGMTIKDIAVKYGIHVTTASKYLTANKHKKTIYENFVPEKVLARADMSELERIKLINEDAITNIELGFAVMRKRLEVEIAILSKDTDVGNTGIGLKDLTALMKEVMPFVLARKEGIKGKSEDSKSATKGKVYQMFKQAK